jgi:hypothetical protein
MHLRYYEQAPISIPTTETYSFQSQLHHGSSTSTTVVSAAIVVRSVYDHGSMDANIRYLDGHT